MQSTIESLKRLKNKKSRVSSHYLISREGSVYQLVEDRKIAWHAGKSKWLNNKNLNRSSIGIELQNRGHRLGYQSFPNRQINKLLRLCFLLKKKYKIHINNILGHSDIAPLRKMDPGENFPWKKFINKKILTKLRNNNFRKITRLNKFDFEDQKKVRKQFFANLYKIGYRYFSLKKRNVKNDKKVIKSFQRKYDQQDVNGKISKKTLIISHLLGSLKLYV